MSATERTPQPQPRPRAAGVVSMRELLASCAAAELISTPPPPPEPVNPAARPLRQSAPPPSRAA
ncbi:hypothetical protein ABZX40_23765 [Streptomyces sp. NPDC004610]|uniref:hypothetical protein n=1 Tax=unclassified Streptomyces TaxID=2593676 RepID=UPI0033A34805